VSIQAARSSLPSCFTQGELRLTRIEAFSDGVFAVAVTLLVLDLPDVSAAIDARELDRSRRD
jgi:hypothetical protein